MANPRPVVILATLADLAVLREDLRTGRRRKLAGFSVQVPGLSPHTTLAVQRSLDGAYLTQAGAEALAAAVLGAGAATVWALGPAGLSGTGVLMALGLGAALGAAFGRRMGLWAARCRIASAVSRLAAHFGSDDEAASGFNAALPPLPADSMSGERAAP